MKSINPNDGREYRMVPTADLLDPDGPWLQCPSCRYPAPLHDYNADRAGGDEPEWSCCLCANAVKVRSEHPQARVLQGLILNVGNTILAALGAFDAAPSVNLRVYPGDAERLTRFLEAVRARTAHLTEEEVAADFDEAIAEVRAERR